MSSATLSVLVLTEDGASAAHDVIVAFTKKAFGLVVQGCRTNHVVWEPANDAARRVVAGNRWKARSGHQARDPALRRGRVDLAQTIATKLAETAEAAGFVVFHVDADTKWSSFDDGIQVLAFRRDVVSPVERVLEKHFPGQAKRLLGKLLLLCPCWEIESWLYQNTTVAVDLCRRHHGGACADTFKAWASDRGLLDELESPKDATPLRDRHNLDLAKTNFPAKALFEVEKSFHRAVSLMKENDDLVVALRATLVK